MDWWRVHIKCDVKSTEASQAWWVTGDGHKQRRKKQRHGGGEPQGTSGSDTGVEECGQTEPRP